MSAHSIVYSIPAQPPFLTVIFRPATAAPFAAMIVFLSKGSRPSTPAPQDADLYSDLSFLGPAWDEDLADKPTWVRQNPSLISAEEVRQELSYLIVAERTNTNGSRQFKRLLQEENWDGLVSMARDEMREGSHMLDVCVDFVGRDGVRDMHEVVRRYVNAIPVPLMLDSTNPAVLEAGLKLVGGRCVLNSMNLEDGEERVAHICGIAKKYGAAVVAGSREVAGRASSAATRLARASRSRSASSSSTCSSRVRKSHPRKLPPAQPRSISRSRRSGHACDDPRLWRR